MSAQGSAPGWGTGGAQAGWLAVTDSSASASTAGVRTRCQRCGHPLTATRSVARAFGPTCWSKTEIGALERHRDQVGRQLAGLARSVARLDLDGLDRLRRVLDEVMDR